jgi:hypothetical protein
VARTLQIFTVALLLGSLGLLWIGFLPLAALKAPIEALVPGRSLALTATRFAVLRNGCRVAALMLLLDALIAFGYRRRVPLFLDSLLRDQGNFREFWRRKLRSLVSDPWLLWPFLGIFFAGIVFRVLELSRPIRLDEAFGYFEFSSHPWYWTISDYSTNNHIFHSLLVSLTTHAFGDALPVLRVPALIGGLLLIPAAFAATASLFSRPAGIAAAGLVACAPPFVDYSALAKGYSWQCFFILLMVSFACRIEKPEATASDWTGFVVASVLGMYTIPTSVLPFIATVIWLALLSWLRGGSSGARAFVTCAVPALMCVLVLVTLLYVPPMIVTGPGMFFANPYVSPSSRADFFAQTPKLLLATWVRWNEGVPWVARTVIYLGFVLGFAAHRKIARHAVSLPAVIFLFCAFVIVEQRLFIYSRVWLFVWLFALITAAAGLAFLLFRPALVAVVAFALALGVGSGIHRHGTVRWSMENGNVQGLDDAASWMARSIEPGDRIIASGLAGPPMEYTLRRTWPEIEPQLDCAGSGLPMCGSRALLTGPPPKRLFAVIAKQPDRDDGYATDPVMWDHPETTPSRIMFMRNSRQEYSEPRVVRDQPGVTIWEARRVSWAQ